MKQQNKRILIAKIGLDGHDRGAKVVARALLDAGFEVHYTGIRQRPKSIIATLVEKKIDILGLSFLSGDHMTQVPRILQELERAGRKDVPVIVGGIILKQQIGELQAMGVNKVFLPGTPLQDIIGYFASVS